MKLLELAEKRYTAKSYLPNKKISLEDRTKMLQAANLAPTSLGLQQSRIIWIENNELKIELSSLFSGFNAEKVKDASALAIFIGLEPAKFLKNDAELITKRKTKDPKNVSEMELEAIKHTVGFYQIPELKEEINKFDVYAAMAQISYLTLEATELGFDSTIMAGFDFAKLSTILKEKGYLLEDERLLLCVSVGVADPNFVINQLVKANKKELVLTN